MQRPHVDQIVAVDLDILITQSRFVAQHSELGARYDIVGITTEFADAVRGELDYHAEGANAERLGQLFAEDETVAFPRVYWEFSTDHILTLERLEGLPFNKPDGLTEADMDRPELAKRGIYCYLEQIFVHGFYHADPHPGNFFVQKGPEGQVRIVVLDLGSATELRSNLAPVRRMFAATARATIGSRRSNPVIATSATPTMTPTDVHTSVSRCLPSASSVIDRAGQA